MPVSYKCEFREYKLEIYNRWGELIFQSSSPDVSWDGTINGKRVKAVQTGGPSGGLEVEIRLDQIKEEPFEWKETPSISAESLDRSGLLGLGEISWEGRVAAIENGFLFQAQMRYEQTLSCDRCLTPFDQSVERDIELRIVPRGPEPVVGELELSEKDLTLLHVDEETLDTMPLLMEQLQLNIPMRALCREDCAGLCPVCGTNRNVEDCACGDSTIDPRWEALRGLKRPEGV